jgi:predicted DNA-binding WGR domain protein
MTYLTRTDPARNMNRFYVVAVTPTLFGEWAVRCASAAVDPRTTLARAGGRLSN